MNIYRKGTKGLYALLALDLILFLYALFMALPVDLRKFALVTNVPAKRA
ncbi:MAG: hypothetical protein P4M11_02795 [Candidatus Pacebacteria bacterium]|nr:hypothetical protein [Candidatus Paceibacterota bacterium]